MGRKPAASEGLRYLVEKGIGVVAVVAPIEDEKIFWKDRLVDTARYYEIPVVTDEDLYNYIDGKSIPKSDLDLRDIDLVISFLFWKRIKKPLIELGRIGCINFHPAPLPDFRGLGGYNFAIYERLHYWGVSAHFVEESIDTGDIIRVRKFEINPDEETAYSLEQKSQRFLIELFKEVIDELCEKGSLPRIPQRGGRYISKQDFEKLRRIQPEDTIEDILRKIRAFWYPPHHGASIEIKGREFTLIDEKLLKEIGEKYHG